MDKNSWNRWKICFEGTIFVAYITERHDTRRFSHIQNVTEENVEGEVQEDEIEIFWYCKNLDGLTRYELFTRFYLKIFGLHFSASKDLYIMLWGNEADRGWDEDRGHMRSGVSLKIYRFYLYTFYRWTLYFTISLMFFVTLFGPYIIQLFFLHFINHITFLWRTVDESCEGVELCVELQYNRWWRRVQRSAIMFWTSSSGCQRLVHFIPY